MCKMKLTSIYVGAKRIQAIYTSHVELAWVLFISNKYYYITWGGVNTICGNIFLQNSAFFDSKQKNSFSAAILSHAINWMSVPKKLPGIETTRLVSIENRFFAKQSKRDMTSLDIKAKEKNKRKIV